MFYTIEVPYPLFNSVQNTIAGINDTAATSLPQVYNRVQ